MKPGTDNSLTAIKDPICGALRILGVKLNCSESRATSVAFVVCFAEECNDNSIESIRIYEIYKRDSDRGLRLGVTALFSVHNYHLVTFHNATLSDHWHARPMPGLHTSNMR